MNKNYFITFLALFGCLSLAAQQGSAWAGEDVVICPSIGDTLGIKTDPCPECCYEWSPAEGLSATNVKNPIAKPNSSQVYTVKVTDAMLRWQETDAVSVDVGFGGLQFSPTFLKQGSADKVTATLQENVNNDPVIWTFNGDSLGCTIENINLTDAEITPGDKYGTVKIRATNVSNPFCYDERDIEINEGVKDIEVRDAQHPNRIAKNGQTLYLVNHNDAWVKAIPNDGGFQDGQPDWRNDLFPCPTPPDGTFQHFTDCIGDEELIAGGMPSNEPKVFIKRIQSTITETPIGSLASLEEAAQEIKEFKFRGSPATLNVDINIGQLKYIEETVEKYASPDMATQKKYTLDISGSVAGHISHPMWSIDIDPPGNAPSVMTDLYIEAGASLAVLGEAVSDPSTADDSWKLSPDFTAEIGFFLKAGFNAEVMVFPWQPEVGFAVQSQVKWVLKLLTVQNRINQKFVAEPLTVLASVRIVNNANPALSFNLIPGSLWPSEWQFRLWDAVETEEILFMNLN